MSKSSVRGESAEPATTAPTGSLPERDPEIAAAFRFLMHHARWMVTDLAVASRLPPHVAYQGAMGFRADLPTLRRLSRAVGVKLWALLLLGDIELNVVNPSLRNGVKLPEAQMMAFSKIFEGIRELKKAGVLDVRPTQERVDKELADDPGISAAELAVEAIETLLAIDEDLSVDPTPAGLRRAGTECRDGRASAGGLRTDGRQAGQEACPSGSTRR